MLEVISKYSEKRSLACIEGYTNNKLESKIERNLSLKISLTGKKKIFILGCVTLLLTVGGVAKVDELSMMFNYFLR